MFKMVELSFREAVALLKADEEKIKLYEAQKQSLLFALQEINTARNSLEAVVTGRNALAPIGAGVLMPIKIGKNKVKVDVGAGVVVEKSVEEAKEILNKREEMIKDTISQIDDEITKLYNTVRDLSAKIQDYLRRQKENDVPVVE